MYISYFVAVGCVTAIDAHVSGGEDSAVGAGMTVAEDVAKREDVAILTNVGM
jgi:bifunctional N-acetylglucosamine-1-phosphate-uridyltransferase/glucosamine-1-phosphate-acetyltransferase GlmU-like protein